MAQVLEPALKKAQDYVKELNAHDHIIAEMDMASRQLSIARWSALASVASAVAAIVAAAIAYMQLRGR